MEHPTVSNEEMQTRIVRFADVPGRGMPLMFIDSILPGHQRMNYSLDIELREIFAVVMGAKPQAILFEASNPRHAHEWVVWEDAAVPDDKILVPGVIDSVTNFVEHPALVAERIGRFAAIVGRERVMAGTDCGFGTFAGFGAIHPTIAYAKFASLAQGAALASARLW